MKPPYYQAGCYLTAVDGTKRLFPNEHELEKFVMACPHTETFRGVDGYLYCTTCFALPLRRLNAN